MLVEGGVNYVIQLGVNRKIAVNASDRKIAGVVFPPDFIGQVDGLSYGRMLAEHAPGYALGD